MRWIEVVAAISVVPMKKHFLSLGGKARLRCRDRHSAEFTQIHAMPPTPLVDPLSSIRSGSHFMLNAEVKWLRNPSLVERMRKLALASPVSSGGRKRAFE
jgi:hypothetical protein